MVTDVQATGISECETLLKFLNLLQRLDLILYL